MKPAAALKVCMTCGVGYPPDALFCPKDGTPLTSSKGVGGGRASSSDDPNAPPEDPYLGRELLEHIEIRQLAGAGAMGRVYRAFQRGIDRDVAVKILHRELSANQQLVSRFHREAKVASRLQHPNVVQVHLAGQLPDGALYIVMEYLDGLSLQSALAAAGGSMPLVRTLRIALQLCDATGEAHAQGVVHRDLKPENVMLVRRGEDSDSVKVLDFGVARLAWGEQSMATAAGLIFGTARYISPEGAQGEAVGPAGDVYAIATLVYQMLSGKTPFDAEQAVALLVQQIHDVPPLMTSHARAAYVPAPIVEAVMKNLAKEPGARDGDARQFGRALLEAATRSGLVEADLVGRSSLVGARPAGALQLASLQRTAGLPNGASGANAAGDAENASRPRPPMNLPSETQRWTPVDAPRITPTPPPDAANAANATAARTPTPAPAFPSPSSPPPRGSAPPSEPRTLDETLDDEDEPAIARDVARAMAGTPSAPVATALARGATVIDEEAPRISGSPGRAPPVGVSPSRPPPRSSRPAARAEEDFDDTAGVPSRSGRSRSARIWAIALLCFLGGIAIFTAIAFRLKLIGPGAKAGSLDDQLAHASTALRLKHWDAPAGDNVRDLTNEGLSKWPHEPRLLEIRERATNEIALEAVSREMAGDQASALHLAQLARELDPTDTMAQQLVDRYQANGSTLATGTGPNGAASAGNATAGSAGTNGADGGMFKGTGARASLDVSPAKARIGQTVSFVAHALGKKTVEEAHFELIVEAQPTNLPADPAGGGAYHGAFTFLVPGKYDVTFAGKVDGAPVHATRMVTVSDPNAPSPDPSASSNGGANGSGTPPAAPSGSVKWL